MKRRWSIGRHLGKCPEHQGSGQVVGQIRHERPRTSSTVVEKPGHVEHHGVRLDDLDPYWLDHAPQDGQEMAIQFHGHHPGSGFGQGQGQGAQTGPEFQYG